MKIGIFSTFIENDALTLVQAVKNAIELKNIPNSEISFIFSNRELGENPITDFSLGTLADQNIPLITYSALKFQSDKRRNARNEEREGRLAAINEWRNLYGQEVLNRLPKTDLDLLLGDMWVWGQNMCEERNGLNLHPALPTGPKGEWYKVIWQLIQEEQKETGVMMHKVTSELDRGPAVSYCSFPLTGPHFDSLWNDLPENTEERSKLIQVGLLQKENATNPLHRKIRQEGFIREIPLIIQTTRAFAENTINIEGGPRNLSSEVNYVLDTPENNLYNKGERKF